MNSTYIVDISELLRGEIGKKQQFSFVLPNNFSEQIVFIDGKFFGDIPYLGEELLIDFSTDEFTNKETCVRCLTECSRITSIDHASESYSLSDSDKNPFNLLSKKDTDESQTFLDLEPLLSQEIGLSFRTHPLCLEDCVGLCPECGTNQNLKYCGCSPKKSPNAFDTLKEQFNSKL